MLKKTTLFLQLGFPNDLCCCVVEKYNQKFCLTNILHTRTCAALLTKMQSPEYKIHIPRLDQFLNIVSILVIHKPIVIFYSRCFFGNKTTKSLPVCRTQGNLSFLLFLQGGFFLTGPPQFQYRKENCQSQLLFQ